MSKNEEFSEETSDNVISDDTAKSLKYTEDQNDINSDKIFYQKNLEESFKNLTKKYEIILEDSLKTLIDKYETFVEDSFKTASEKYNNLLSDVKIVHEENNEIKTEVRKLRKELEISTSSQQPRDFIFPVSLDDFQGSRKRGSSLGNISSRKFPQFDYPYNSQLEFGQEGNTNKTLKSFLASLKCRHLWYAVFILFLVTGIAVTMTMLIPTKTEEDWDSNVSKTTSLILYTREEWGAVKPRGEVAALEQNPPHYVIIAHTAGRNCSTFPLCAQAVRDTQMDHMGRGWEDLGMHFLVGGDGGAYTGLGWGKHGAHTIPFNRRSIAIYFIGNFMFDLPPKRQIKAAKLLIEEGVRLGKIAPIYKLFAQKQVWATLSPGAALIEDIKTWPHWSAYESSDE